jgi:hypothetical protein
MRGHDLHDVLLPAGIAFGGRPGPGIGRGRGAHLDTGVHVGFVIEADVEDILVILCGSRKRRQADIERPPVPCEGHDLDIALALQLEPI